MQFCVFRLYAPLVSWGDIAVGIERKSYFQPSKSAVIGMTAAALGIKRTDEKKLMQLFDSFSFGVKLINPGESITDYHTAQTSKQGKNAAFHTRSDELLADHNSLNTVLSSREYRCNSLSVIALWKTQNAATEFSLQEIQHALLFPEYHLYLGRKSCPPALPLEPQIIPAETMKEAFDNAKFGPVIIPLSDDEHDRAAAKGIEESVFYSNNQKTMYFWDNCENSGFQTWTKRSEKYDRPISRNRWQFGLRYEFSAIFDEGEK